LFPTFTYELLALSDHMQYIYAMGQLYSPGALFRKGIQYALDPGNEAMAQKDLEWFERCCGPYLPFRTGEKTILGRLGIVEALTPAALWQLGILFTKGC